jgi:hypothetical protein
MITLEGLEQSGIYKTFQLLVYYCCTTVVENSRTSVYRGERWRVR